MDAAARLHDFMHRPSPIIAWGGEPMPAKAPAEPEITPTWVTLSVRRLPSPARPHFFVTTAKTRAQERLTAADSARIVRVCAQQKVLRFSGFCEESVQESQIETRRVRKIELLYYLEDDTVQVRDYHTRARATATKTTAVFVWLVAGHKTRALANSSAIDDRAKDRPAAECFCRCV